MKSASPNNIIASDTDAFDTNGFAHAEVGELDLYQKREKIYTRTIEGFFQRIRTFTGWPLLYGYFLLPWLNWYGRQSVLFDLPARKFYILGLTFWPQDFSMLAWVLAIAAFSLFLFTALFGRVWCGYTCPQTVWTSIFMWIEQYTEGSRNQRIKLDEAPWSMNKALRKTAKHSLWFGFAFFTGFTFVGYFTPIHELGYTFFTSAVNLTALFWVMLFTVATYVNAGWMREQVCMYMCPYARFQSAMFDKNTLIVSYDKKRGEPRGSRKHTIDHHYEEKRADGLGDCIDCQLCVQVCPTGIDIRNGLQYQCIGCALCIDACNSVMDKMHYPKGLIRYTTENKLSGLPGKIMRPRVIGYIIAITIMCALLGYKLLSRTPLQLDVIRDRGQLYIVRDDDSIENSYTLNIMNMDNSDHRYRIGVSGMAGLSLLGDTEFNLQSGEVRKVPVRLSLAAGHVEEHEEKEKSPKTNQDIYFSATALDNDRLHAQHKSRFILPDHFDFAQ